MDRTCSCASRMSSSNISAAFLLAFHWTALDVAVDVPEFDPSPGFWWNFLVQMLYNPVLALVKASILFFLLRLGGQKKSARYAIYALNIFNAAHAVAIFFTALFQCVPMEANWDFALRFDPETNCIDNSFHVIGSCLTIFTDLCILILPFWIFPGLKMPRAAKMVVTGVFLLGSLVAVVGVIRVVDVYKIFFGTPDPDTDPYYNITVVYSSVEVNLAIITATIPKLRPLFPKWFPSLFSGSSGQSHGRPTYGTSGYGSRSRGAQTLQSGDHSGSKGISLTKIGRHHTSQTEVLSASPNDSEEEIMRYHVIVRTTNVQVEYEDRSQCQTAQAGSWKAVWMSWTCSCLVQLNEPSPLNVLLFIRCWGTRAKTCMCPWTWTSHTSPTGLSNDSNPSTSDIDLLVGGSARSHLNLDV
ncbi:uncharacterized protein F5Z01DRAFT_699210 [Emericellopsis atlantica]|uniref:Rhodopsin domain-containing protein n=1 Tax=Emericellopsis atlantica TaxID=2614577 RepID=A0A9P8CQV5_9HYPO|nr:uncharacterized protein F5Z01DRAFT_699210 [Emericellopsis atlantica]KAG9255525.1 hypothetical protein F5Z01DRAFT_699210 [Emericellopsis atlantica]